MRKYMEIAWRGLKCIAAEVLIVFLLIFLINNYLESPEKRINADGIGYYDYLPSVFIHGDINRKGKTRQEHPGLYERIGRESVYNDYKDYKVNKYPCGTALLQLPFFAWAYLNEARTGLPDDGYQQPYQKAVFHAAVFYLFLSLFFLKKLLKLYRVGSVTIILTQLLLVLGTSVTHYVNYDPAFSHVYSLFAITAFLFFARAFFITNRVQYFTAVCVSLGLIIILRQVNGLIIFAAPFLAGSWPVLKVGVRWFRLNFRKALPGLLAMLAIIGIQCLLWYMQTGEVILYSYQGEGFNFSDPEMINILFSYRKGLFVYTPVLLLALLGLLWFLYRREYYPLLTWTAFFLLLTYVLSSWHSWYYGCSYGLRAYIDYYAVFFVLFAVVFDAIRRWARVVVATLALLTIPLNLIQTYQYGCYILHWIDMDKEKYWNVFLKQSDIYRGFLWKKTYNYDDYTCIKEITVDDVRAKENFETLVFQAPDSAIPYFNRVSIIQITLDNWFRDDDSSKIIVSIDNSDGSGNIYYHNPWLMHFAESRPGRYQNGIYNYEFIPAASAKPQQVACLVKTVNRATELKNIKMRFLVPKDKLLDVSLGAEFKAKLTKYEEMIRSDKKWLELVRQKALDQNVPLDTMIRRDAIWMISRESR